MPKSVGDAASISPSLTSASTTSRPPPIFSNRPTFTLQNFQNRDFLVQEFIETLSDSAISQRRSSTTQAAFDPKPLIRTFEAAATRLGSLSSELSRHENELSAAVRRADAQHQSVIQSHKSRFETITESFRTIDVKLNGDVGGSAAAKVGERLEELDKQVQRAKDAKFLIQCWLEVKQHGHMATLEDHRRLGGAEGKARCAHIARQLLKISQRLEPDRMAGANGKIPNDVNGVEDGEGTQKGKRNTREVIERFLEDLEKDLLKQFDDLYQRQNYEGMRECAIALHDFNEGASVIGLFVNQHTFFIERSQMITEDITTDAELSERLADPDTEPPGVEPTLQSLVDEVRIVVQKESFIIQRAFPYYEEVLVRFLQRIFQQSIQQCLEVVLDKANSISSLAFLRSLQAARSYLGILVEDLKAHGLTEHPEPVTPTIAASLDQQLDELFIPYLAGSSYIERERRNLEELYSSLLFKFTLYHSRRRKVPTTYLGTLGQRGKELLASARDAYQERLESTDLPPSQKVMLLRIAGVKEESVNSKNEIDVTELDGALSLPNAKRMLKWLAEGIGRGLELSGGNETPKDVSNLLNLLLAHLSEIYLETALDAAAEQAAAQETSKTAPDLSYIPDLRTGISITHLLQTTVHAVLLPLASSSPTIRRSMENKSKAALGRIEERINTTLQRTIDAVLSWISRLLSNQKRTDFRPRDEAEANQVSSQFQTPTCLSVVQFLPKIRVTIETSLGGSDSPNAQSFGTELGLGIRTLLVQHLQRFQINLAGGLVVCKDLAKYVEALKELPLEEGFEEDQLDALSEVGTLFVIGPEALKERIRGLTERSGGWDRATLRGFLAKREDVGSVGVQSVLAHL